MPKAGQHPAQRNLIFERDEKLRLIEAAMRAELPAQVAVSYQYQGQQHTYAALVTGPTRRALHDLLIAIELTGFRYGCMARIEVLASHCNRRPRRVRQLVRLAEAMELLAVDRDRLDKSRRGGTGPNEYSIQWDRVRQLAESARAVSPKSAGRAAISAGRAAISAGPIGIVKVQGNDQQTTPPTPLADDRIAASEADEWGKVAVAFRELGLHLWRATASLAQERGASLHDARSLIEFYRANSARWHSPGVLRRRIDEWSPGQNAASGWPEPTVEAKRERQSQARDTNREAEMLAHAAAKQKSQAERASLRKLDTKWRPRFAAMRAEDLRTLVERALGQDFTLMRLWRREGLESVLVREEVYRYLGAHPDEAALLGELACPGVPP